MSFSKLTMLYTLTILFCGRAGLLLHEMVGHGLIAERLGAHVTNVELHWFGGGSVHFHWPDDFPHPFKFCIYFGGIFIEMIVAAFLWWSCPKRHLWLTQVLACVLILHSLFYWATSTQGNFGDGRQLHAFFPLSITLQVSILTALFWLSCFILSKKLWHWSHALNSGATIIQHLLFHGGAITIAILVHGSLSYGESTYFNSASLAHNIVFKPEYEFQIDQLRSEYLDQHHKQPSQEWQMAKEQELRPWPHFSLFIVCTGLLFGMMGIVLEKKERLKLNAPAITPIVGYTCLSFMLIWMIKVNF